MVAKLTQDEKFVIQGRLSNGEDVKDIAKSIQRQAKTVQAYVDGELNEIQNTIVGVQAENLTVEELQVLLDEEKAKVTELQGQIPQEEKHGKRDPKNKGFINKTPGGAKGIAVMTNVASEISDELRKKYPKTLARTARGNLYNIDDQKVIE